MQTKHMLFRFCLYGFLKNQRYFEPFLVLVFLEKGLSFFQIGLLVASREVTINVFEILSGALADVYGRRRAMIVSFSAYIISFMIFGLATRLCFLFLAMVLFGVGDAFRTGTHKAMIFSWLRLQCRIDERTRIYGKTRSWSKIGSAVSVVLASVFVLVSKSYTIVFYFSVIPYIAGLVNFLGYPKEIDNISEQCFSVQRVVIHLKKALKECIRSRNLRTIMFESMGFEGLFKSAKDYLQPILSSFAMYIGTFWALGVGFSDQQKTACFIGPVYFILYLMSAFASRNTYRLVRATGSEDQAAHYIWWMNGVIFAVLVPAMVLRVYLVMVIGFVALFILQNAWRPILISRFDSYSKEKYGATVLSLESQAKSLATMVIAPFLGWLVDLVRECGGIGGEFWPVGAFGLVVALVNINIGKHYRR